MTMNDPLPYMYTTGKSFFSSNSSSKITNSTKSVNKRTTDSKKKNVKSKERVTKNSSKKKITENKVNDIDYSKYKDISVIENPKYRDIMKKIDKTLDNSFRNIEDYKDKFYEWMMYYLYNKKKCFCEIKESFVDYLIKTSKDEGMIVSIKVLSNDARFDINLYDWIEKLVNDKVLVEFKLASNSKLKDNLAKQVDIYKKASKTDKAITAILYFTEKERTKLFDILNELKLYGNEDIVTIDARNDNKPSASNAKI